MSNRREFLARSVASAVALASARSLAAEADASGITPALLKRAQSLLDKAPLIDTHNDLPSMFLERGAGGKPLCTFLTLLLRRNFWPDSVRRRAAGQG